MFQPYLNFFVIVFIDDLLAYSKREVDLVKYLRITVQRLKDEKLYVTFSKCELWLYFVPFLGHVAYKYGFMVDLAKVDPF